MNVVQDGSRRRATVGVIIALSYLVGLIGTIANPSRIYCEMAHQLSRYVWQPAAFFLLLPLFCLWWFFTAFAGTTAFVSWGRSFHRTRLTMSSLMVAGLYLGGNSLHFSGEQWMYLDLYMCVQLIVLGYTFPKTQLMNWAAFGLLVLAFVLHVRISTWVILDYIWGLYFAIAACAPWVLRIG